MTGTWDKLHPKEHALHSLRSYHKHKKARDSYNKKWQSSNPKKRTEYAHTSHERLRNQIIDLLGSKCKKCFHGDIRVLQVDHVNGGGHRELRGLGRWGMLKKIISKNGKGYQLLCANCHVLKHRGPQ